eukprot:jgi/Pico_ML_1/51931/g2722.t2
MEGAQCIFCAGSEWLVMSLGSVSCFQPGPPIPFVDATSQVSAAADVDTLRRVAMVADALSHRAMPGIKISAEEGKVRAVSEIVDALVSAVQAGRDVNLNALKAQASRKYGLAKPPKLVEIIAAVPEEQKNSLLPRLKAKPVRTASGIAVVAVMHVLGWTNSVASDTTWTKWSSSSWAERS